MGPPSIQSVHDALPDRAAASIQSAYALETVNLTRRVGDRILVDGVTITVAQGEVLAITGPSGAGKSSFLRLVNRLDEPTTGTILMKGRDYREYDPATLRRRVGMVMQSANLFPGTVLDNLTFGPAQRHATIRADRIDNLLSKVGLAGYADHNVNTLSGGEAQRVSFARTLANDPEILLLDEPTSALDDESGRAIEQLITDITADTKITCLIVTHNVQQAARIAKRTMFMAGGKLVTVGPTKEVLNAYGSL